MTNEFEVKTGVRQSDALSTIIFNLMLHYAIGTLDRGGHIFIRSSIICAYADDIANMATKFNELKIICLMLEKEAAKVRLKINESKTKHIRMTRVVTETTSQYITINNYNFESVNSFTYLGALRHNKNDMDLIINDRIQAAQKCFYAYNKLFKSRLLNRSIKLRMYKTLIQLTLTYSCETWTLTPGDEEKLKIFERKLIRKIFGPKINEEGEYEIRSNQELDDLIQRQNIVKKAKAQRLRWAVIRLVLPIVSRRALHFSEYLINTVIMGHSSSLYCTFLNVSIDAKFDKYTVSMCTYYNNKTR